MVHPRVQQFNRFLNGPLRNRLLITREVLRIVAREQQLLPSLNSWPHAKQAYIESFNALRHQIQLFGVSGSFLDDYKKPLGAKLDGLRVVLPNWHHFITLECWLVRLADTF